MRLQGLILLCLATAVLTLGEVTVDVYMESQCPYCVRFINDQLKKAVNTADLEKILKIEIFPYGNAKQVLNDKGGYDFTCQHGPTECYGNILEVCAMSKIQNQFDKIKFVLCIEESSPKSIEDFDKASSKCAPIFNLDFNQIKLCTESSQGNLLQHEVAEATMNLNPPHSYVPYIVANGQHDGDYEAAIQTDIVKWVCATYKGVDVIEACKA